MAKAKAETAGINKSQVIREAIVANPDVGNTDLAKLLETQHPGHKFPIPSIATTRSKMKKAIANGETRPFLTGGTGVGNGKATRAKPTRKVKRFPGTFDFPAPASSPFIAQVRMLKELLGADAVKKIVDEA